jgi:hypothetical protein
MLVGMVEPLRKGHILGCGCAAAAVGSFLELWQQEAHTCTTHGAFVQLNALTRRLQRYKLMM